MVTSFGRCRPAWLGLVILGLAGCDSSSSSNHGAAALPQATTAAVRDAIVPDGAESGAKSIVAPARSTTATADSEAPRDQAFAIAGLNDSVYRQRLAPELAYADEPQANWQSEVFQDRAVRRLKDLLQAAIRPTADVDVGTVASLDQIQVASLLPLASSVYRDGSVQVRRWSSDAPTQTPGGTEPRVADDPPSAAGSLRQLTDGVAAGTEPRIELKIIDVQLLGDEARTRVLVEMLAAGPTTRLCRNQTWACRWGDVNADVPTLREVELTQFEEVVADTVQTQFVDVTRSVLASQASFAQQLDRDLDDWRRRIDWRFGLDIVGSHGLAVGDVNGDELDDLFVCETGGLPNRLYLQRADGTAEDVSAAAGIDYLEPTHSALLLDFDNDGDQDLIIGSGRYLLWFSNDGRGQFQRAGIHESNAMIRSMAAIDYDSNGLLDVYVCGYFPRDASGDGVGLGRPLPYHDANNGTRNYLMSNQGRLQFRDVTDEIGLDENNRRFSYACAWADYDADGDQDLYVANDFGRNNLYQNQGGRFVDVAAAAGVEDISAGMSASWGDYDRDGRLDLYVGNMYSSAGNRVSYQREFLPGADDSHRQQFQRHARGNSLFRNLGENRFADVSLQAGVNMGRWAWSSNFVDLNNDGWEDLMVANGMVTARNDPGDL